jgi:hypothetical protein
MLGAERSTAFVDFTVPAGAGDYAVEVLRLKNERNVATGLYHQVEELVVHVESLPAGARVEVDVLKANGNPSVEADWVKNIDAAVAVGTHAPLELASWNGVRIRGKSGGAAGSAKAHVAWHGA